MTDLSRTIVPRSDQMNADDLIGGPRTIKVTRVTATSAPDQPIAVYFEGDDGKPYKPGLSMRRVLVRVWGIDGNAYVGRRMTLYRDDKVRFGGMDVGGIRISHMSDLDGVVTMALTDKKGSRKPFRVEPLAAEQAPAAPKPIPEKGRIRLLADARREAGKGSFALAEFRHGLHPDFNAALEEIAAELTDIAESADAAAGPADDFPGADALDAARERESVP